MWQDLVQIPIQILVNVSIPPSPVRIPYSFLEVHLSEIVDRRFLSIDDLTNMPTPSWAIEGIFERNSLVMLAGPPASYKSFLALDWILCMATGRKWCNRMTTPAKILYVLGEGKASLLKRIQIWIHYNKLTPEEMARLRVNFRVSFNVPQLASKPSVDNMLAELVAEDFTPDVITIDTFARSFVGLDENSQKDTGLWIEQADRLRQLGYTVIFLHHTCKNTEFGVKYRGSTAIMGAMDTAMTLVRTDTSSNKLVLTVTKQKDHDEGSPMFFQRVIVKPFGGSDEGSVVLIPTVQVDERFTEEYRNAEAEIKKIMDDDSYDSDYARAKVLAPVLGVSENAIKLRIARKRGVK